VRAASDGRAPGGEAPLLAQSPHELTLTHGG
jgi:hypothetical protein